MASYSFASLDADHIVLLENKTQQRGVPAGRVFIACIVGMALGSLLGLSAHAPVSHQIIQTSQVHVAPAQLPPQIVHQARPSAAAQMTASAVAAIGATLPTVAAAAPFEELGVETSPLYGYFNMFTPIVDALGDNTALVHWLHPVNMGIVLVAMGGYGTYLGWQIRNRRLAGDAPPPAGLAGATHPLLMGLMAFLFFLGAQGGLLFTLYEGRPLLASDHSTTAILSLLLLGAQGVLGKTMGDSDTKRTLHAYLGSALMGLLVVHAILGLQLGLST